MCFLQIPLTVQLHLDHFLLSCSISKMTPLVIGGSVSQLLCYDALKVVMAEILKCLPRACIWRPTGPQLVVLLLGGGVVEIFREWSLLRESRSLGEETGVLRHNPTSLHRFLPILCLLITNQLPYIPTGVESASMSHSHTGSTSNHDQKQTVLPWIVPGSFAPTAYAWLIKRWAYAVVTALSPLTPCTGHKDSADSVQSPTNTILQSSVWRSLLTLSLRTWLFFSPSVFVRF